MWGFSLQLVCTKKKRQLGEECWFLFQFFKAKKIFCGSDQSQFGASSQSWKTLGKVLFGWVRILLSSSVVDDSRLRLSAIFAAVVDTRGRWEM